MSRTPARIGMAPPHPGAFIRDEILDELGLTVSEAATVLEVRRATLSDLINDNAALSAEMALRIEKPFGVKMQTPSNVRAWHDAYTMRQRAGEIAVKPYRPLSPNRADKPGSKIQDIRHSRATWFSMNSGFDETVFQPYSLHGAVLGGKRSSGAGFRSG